MSKIRSVLMMLRGHMADWLHSPRTLISGLVVLALTYMNARNYVFLLESNELYSHFGEAVFYYLSSGFGKCVVSGNDVGSTATHSSSEYDADPH